MTAPLIAQPRGCKYTPVSRESAFATFRQWAEHRCEAGARFYFSEAERALGIGAKTSRQFAARGIEEGWLLSYGERSGMAVVGVAVREVTLADLVSAAESAQGQVETTKGRRDVKVERRLNTISKSQFESARAAAGVLAWGITGDRRALRAVGREHFTWDASAGEFTLVRRVAEWSDALVGATTAVARKENKAAREKHLAGVRLLLDLAASKGLIAKGPERKLAFSLYAPELHDWVETTADALAGPDATVKLRTKRRDGMRVLARARTLAGWLDAEQVDWGKLVESIRQGDYKQSQYAEARAAYAGMRRMGMLPASAPDWGTRQRARAVLVPNHDCVKAGVTKDFSTWSGLEGLTGGIVGLAGYASWIDRDATPTLLKQKKLPPKARPNPTPEQRIRAIRRARRGRPEWHRTGTVIGRDLYQVVLYAEWAKATRGIDPSRQGALVELLDVDLLEAYFEQRAREQELPSPKSVMFAQTAYACSIIASPYGEACAQREGDAELAERLRVQSVALFELSERSMPLDEERDGAMEKVGVWEADGVEGYTKLSRLVDLLVDEVEVHGGIPLAAQLAAIRSGTFVPINSARWAAAVRGAVLMALCRRVPLRAANWAMLQIGPRFDKKGRLVRAAHWIVADGAALWEGPIALDFLANEMKSGRAFTPTVIMAREVGDAAAEADLRRDLLELWLRPNGAREEALRLPDGTVAPSPFLFPALARVGTRGGSGVKRRARGYRVAPSQISDMFRTVVLRHAKALGLSRRRLGEVFGAPGIHAIRHLFGTYWIRRGHLKFASVMLDHATTTITEELYTAVRAADVSVDAMARNSTLRVDDLAERMTVTTPATGPSMSPSLGFTLGGSLLCAGCYEPRRVLHGRAAPICHVCKTTETFLSH